MKKLAASIFLLSFVLIHTYSQNSIDTFLVKPYLQYGTKQSMTVLWETHRASTAILEYGEAKRKAEVPNLENNILIDTPKTLHEVQIKDLKTATKYLYRVLSISETGDTLKSPVSTFQTTVQDEDAFTFALVGDSQYNSRTPWAWGVIADKVWQDRPHFIVHAGDLVDVGTRKTDWTTHFFPNGYKAMSRFPMYTVLGNHEQDAQFYYDYMANPAPEYYYTFTYGNAQFFMIDTNRDVQEGSEQYDWLEWQLAQSSAEWKFVVHHHPPYSSEENDHGDTYMGASTFGTHARNLVPLYEAYGVDFCLFGHTHVYERTWPLLKDKINLKNGVVYINSGGAGGGLEDFDPVRSWFTQELQTGHHYCTFSIFENQLLFKAIDHEGRLFDTFQLTKSEKDDISMIQPPAPHFQVDRYIFEKKAKVTMTALKPDYKIYYSLDGSTPDKNAILYTAPFEISQTTTIRARCYTEDGKASRIVERSFKKMKPQPATKVKTANRGLKYAYYEGAWDYLPDFSILTPIRSGIVSVVDVEKIEPRENHFAIVMEGYLEIPETDTYTLYTYSDDGSKLYLNDELLVDSDGRHSAKYIYGTTILEKGKHKIRIEYFEGNGNNFVYAGFVKPNNEKIPFTPFQLSH